jgi:hypothetical protein
MIWSGIVPYISLIAQFELLDDAECSRYEAVPSEARYKHVVHLVAGYLDLFT